MLIPILNLIDSIYVGIKSVVIMTTIAEDYITKNWSSHGLTGRSQCALISGECVGSHSSEVGVGVCHSSHMNRGYNYRQGSWTL